MEEGGLLKGETEGVPVEEGPDKTIQELRRVVRRQTCKRKERNWLEKVREPEYMVGILLQGL